MGSSLNSTGGTGCNTALVKVKVGTETDVGTSTLVGTGEILDGLGLYTGLLS